MANAIDGATIVTNFGAVTAVVPASFTISFNEVQCAALLAELTTAFTPTANRTTFPNLYALGLALLAANNLTAPIGSNGTAPPQTTTVTG